MGSGKPSTPENAYLEWNTVILLLGFGLSLKDSFPQLCTFLEAVLSPKIPQVLCCAHVDIPFNNTGKDHVN